jgi:hypothetical protein
LPVAPKSLTFTIIDALAFGGEGSASGGPELVT